MISAARAASLIVNRFRGCFARLFQIRWIARKPSLAGISVGDRGGNRLIDFVCQGGG